MAVGMPLPQHPVGLFIVFTFVSFAFIGLGLVIAMLADNVPAVQALGQCIFLPMLIIGGIAVRLDALPEWAQHLSAFFPGRYAVDAIQASVSGSGPRGAEFELLALTLIGAAGCLAAAKMFRWDSAQRFAATPGRAWVGVALAAWLAVGLMAERRGGVVARMTTGADGSTVNVADVLVSGPNTARTDDTPAEMPGAQSGTAAAIVAEDPTSSHAARGFSPAPGPGTSASPTPRATAQASVPAA